MGDKEIVRLLVQFGRILTFRTYRGMTDLHFASEVGHLSMMMYLVELQGEGLYGLNSENETPRHLPARSARDYIVKYLPKEVIIVALHRLMVPLLLILPIKMDITQRWNVS
jgi:ankyrin repeat protein